MIREEPEQFKVKVQSLYVVMRLQLTATRQAEPTSSTTATPSF